MLEMTAILLNSIINFMIGVALPIAPARILLKT